MDVEIISYPENYSIADIERHNRDHVIPRIKYTFDDGKYIEITCDPARGLLEVRSSDLISVRPAAANVIQVIPENFWERNKVDDDSNTLSR